MFDGLHLKKTVSQAIIYAQEPIMMTRVNNFHRKYDRLKHTENRHYKGKKYPHTKNMIPTTKRRFPDEIHFPKYEKYLLFKKKVI